MMNLNDKDGITVLQILQNVALEQANKSKPSLVLCFEKLRKLLNNSQILSGEGLGQGSEPVENSITSKIEDDEVEEGFRGTEADQRVFIPYLKTNGFAWNCHGQLACFSS